MPSVFNGKRYTTSQIRVTFFHKRYKFVLLFFIKELSFKYCLAMGVSVDLLQDLHALTHETMHVLFLFEAVACINVRLTEIWREKPRRAQSRVTLVRLLWCLKSSLLSLQLSLYPPELYRLVLSIHSRHARQEQDPTALVHDLTKIRPWT